jgi:4-amino-4-deoxy-L-arabinose transferase-like glycosyltransferase
VSGARADGWASGRGLTSWAFLFPLFVFLSAYVAVNVVFSTGFHADEAEQILFSQSLDAGYEAQPPLYSWLVRLSFAVFSPSFFAFAFLKALILGAVFLGLYLSARTMLRDGPRATLTAFSIFLIPLFGWSAVGYLTHTILLAAACTGTVYALLRIHEAKTWGCYGLLGLMLGLGALTKYNYALFASALLLSALTIGSYRIRLLNWRMLAALAIAVALVLPHALYLVAHWAPITNLLRFKAGAGTLTGDGAAKAARDLVTNSLLILAPLGITGVLFFPQILRRRQAAAEQSTTEPILPTQEDRDRDNLCLLERYFLILMLLLGLVIVAGAKRFNDRWLQPFALVAPLYLFGRLRGMALRPWRVSGYAVTLAGCAAVLIAVRAGQLLRGGSPGCPYALQSLTGAAVRLRIDLGPGATTIASQRAIAGNCCYWLPQMRHLCADRPMYFPPCRFPQRKLALIWDAAEGESLPLPLHDFVAQKWHIYIASDAPVQVLEVRSPRGHAEQLRYIVLSPGKVVSDDAQWTHSGNGGHP